MKDERVWDIRAHGAVAGDHSETARTIQDGVDGVASQGGGAVLVPAGTWRCDDLRLRTGVRLRLQAGAVVEGRVWIDGADEAGVVGNDPATSVVRGVSCSNAKRLTLENFSGSHASFSRCEDGAIRALHLHQKLQRQAEGSVVWLAHCRNLRFSHCDLSSNDDVFCIKRQAADITLTRSVLRGHLAAPFKIGTETDGAIERIRFTDSIIYHSDRAALTLESVDGTHLRDVAVSNIRMINVASPLFIRLGARDRFAEGVGCILGISLHRIEAIGVSLDEGYGSCISGLPGHPVEDVSLSDIRFSYRGGGSRDLVRRNVPERADLYPEYDMFGKLPAYGFYCRHVRGLRFRSVAVQFADPEFRPALLCDDVEDLELDGFDALAWPAARFSIRNDGGHGHYRYPDEVPRGEPAIELRNCRRVAIDRCRAPFGVPFLRLRGRGTDQVRLRGNDTDASASPALELGEEVDGRVDQDVPLAAARVERWDPPAPPCVSTSLPEAMVRIGRHTFTSLPAAVNAAREGDTIVVAGEHRLNPGEFPLVVSKAGITIRSDAGPVAARIVAVGADERWLSATDGRRRGSLLCIEADGVTVEGLTLTGALYNVSTDGSSKCAIRNNAFDFCKRWHMYLANGSGHQAIGNRSRAALNCILRLERCRSCAIRGHVSHEDPAGIRLSGSSSNVIEACEFHAISWDAVLLDNGSDDNVVRGNRFLGGRLTGMQIRASHGTRVESNVFREHKTEAILVDRGASGVLIRQNGFEGNRGLAVSNETEFSVDARENWWGSADGPGGEGPGAGDMVDRSVLYDPWLPRPPAA